MPSSVCSTFARVLRPLPTQRSSDLIISIDKTLAGTRMTILGSAVMGDLKIGDSISVNGACLTVVSKTDHNFSVEVSPETLSVTTLGDRKSTRLNSSHLGISYAVFCLLYLRSRSTPSPYTTLFRSHHFDRQDPRRNANDDSGLSGDGRSQNRGQHQR